ncbi:hypothetical protein Q6272_31135, partial [Klebsiella pneumoniae]|uniref:hypothetical protein n=1 Tax=Klebsiella pneumoniae TaxID=573 RepID=UPI00272F05C9
MKRYPIDRRSLLRNTITSAIGLTALPYIGTRALADDATAQRALKWNFFLAVARWTFDFVCLEGLCQLCYVLG